MTAKDHVPPVLLGFTGLRISEGAWQAFIPPIFPKADRESRLINSGCAVEHSA